MIFRLPPILLCSPDTCLVSAYCFSLFLVDIALLRFDGCLKTVCVNQHFVSAVKYAWQHPCFPTAASVCSEFFSLLSLRAGMPRPRRRHARDKLFRVVPLPRPVRAGTVEGLQRSLKWTNISSDLDKCNRPRLSCKPFSTTHLGGAQYMARTKAKFSEPVGPLWRAKQFEGNSPVQLEIQAALAASKLTKSNLRARMKTLCAIPMLTSSIVSRGSLSEWLDSCKSQPGVSPVPHGIAASPLTMHEYIYMTIHLRQSPVIFTRKTIILRMIRF